VHFGLRNRQSHTLLDWQLPSGMEKIRKVRTTGVTEPEDFDYVFIEYNILTSLEFRLDKVPTGSCTCECEYD